MRALFSLTEHKGNAYRSRLVVMVLVVKEPCHLQCASSSVPTFAASGIIQPSSSDSRDLAYLLVRGQNTWLTLQSGTYKAQANTTNPSASIVPHLMGGFYLLSQLLQVTSELLIKLLERAAIITNFFCRICRWPEVNTIELFYTTIMGMRQGKEHPDVLRSINDIGPSGQVRCVATSNK